MLTEHVIVTSKSGHYAKFRTPTVGIRETKNFGKVSIHGDDGNITQHSQIFTFL